MLGYHFAGRDYREVYTSSLVWRQKMSSCFNDSLQNCLAINMKAYSHTLSNIKCQQNNFFSLHRFWNAYGQNVFCSKATNAWWCVMFCYLTDDCFATNINQYSCFLNICHCIIYKYLVFYAKTSPKTNELACIIFTNFRRTVYTHCKSQLHKSSVYLLVFQGGHLCQRQNGKLKAMINYIIHKIINYLQGMKVWGNAREAV